MRLTGLNPYQIEPMALFSAGTVTIIKHIILTKVADYGIAFRLCNIVITKKSAKMILITHDIGYIKVS